MAYDFPPNIANLSLVDAVKVLILSFTGGTGTIPSGGGGVPVSIDQTTPGTTNGVVVNQDLATGPATTAAAVTPSDSTALTSRGVWVGGAGDLSVRLSGAPSTTVVFTAVPAGTLLPISVVRVMAATTATNINVLA